MLGYFSAESFFRVSVRRDFAVLDPESVESTEYGKYNSGTDEGPEEPKRNAHKVGIFAWVRPCPPYGKTEHPNSLYNDNDKDSPCFFLNLLEPGVLHNCVFF